MHKEIKNKKILVATILILGTIAFSFLFFYNRSSNPFFNNTNSSNTASSTEIGQPKYVLEKAPFQYVEVTDSCGPYFNGDCLNVRSGPGTEYDVVTKIRDGAVLKISGQVQNEGHTWQKIIFDEWLRYPERVKGDWYIASDFTKALFGYSDNATTTTKTTASSKSKTIVVSLSRQTLFAYDENGLFMQAPVSTGIDPTPTPKGIFKIFKKTPSRYMQGPIEGITSKYYDLPGVPWNLYFTVDGAVIHGTYWHDNFGKKHSNGCVNLTVTEAKKLYDWAEINTPVIVVD